jgi:hypothetical protein
MPGLTGADAGTPPPSNPLLARLERLDWPKPTAEARTRCLDRLREHLDAEARDLGPAFHPAPKEA